MIWKDWFEEKKNMCKWFCDVLLIIFNNKIIYNLNIQAVSRLTFQGFSSGVCKQCHKHWILYRTVQSVIMTGKMVAEVFNALVYWLDGQGSSPNTSKLMLGLWTRLLTIYVAVSRLTLHSDLDFQSWDMQRKNPSVLKCLRDKNKGFFFYGTEYFEISKMVTVK